MTGVSPFSRTEEMRSWSRPRECTNAGSACSSWYIPSSVMPSDPFMARNVPHSWTTRSPFDAAGDCPPASAARSTPSPTVLNLITIAPIRFSFQNPARGERRRSPRWAERLTWRNRRENFDESAQNLENRIGERLSSGRTTVERRIEGGAKRLGAAGVDHADVLDASAQVGGKIGPVFTVLRRQPVACGVVEDRPQGANLAPCDGGAVVDRQS